MDWTYSVTQDWATLRSHPLAGSYRHNLSMSYTRILVFLDNHIYCTEQDSCSTHVEPYSTAMTLCNIKKEFKMRQGRPTEWKVAYSRNDLPPLQQWRYNLQWPKSQWRIMSGLQERERQRERLYDLQAMNPSSVNAIIQNCVCTPSRLNLQLPFSDKC
jgi:hypothetical protein